MKKKDFIKGNRVYIFETDSRVSPDNIYIDEVEVEEYLGCGWGSVWDFANESIVDVELKDVYSTYEEAEKALLKFLLKTLKEYTVENVI